MIVSCLIIAVNPKQTGKKTVLEKRNVQSLLQFSNPCYFTSEGVVCWDLIGAKQLKEFLPNKNLHNINPYQPLYPRVRKKEALSWIRAR